MKTDRQFEIGAGGDCKKDNKGTALRRCLQYLQE